MKQKGIEREKKVLWKKSETLLVETIAKHVLVWNLISLEKFVASQSKINT